MYILYSYIYVGRPHHSYTYIPQKTHKQTPHTHTHTQKVSWMDELILVNTYSLLAQVSFYLTNTV